jgi:uncharacterized protein (TIGR02246 family)
MDNGATDQTEIRSLLDTLAKAVQTKDAQALASTFAPDVVEFDVVNPLRRIGSDEARARARDWFASFRGPIGYEIRDLSIAAGGDVAFSHHLYRVSGTLADGGTVRMWVRATLCYRRVGGTWLITHAHNSVPFDPETGRASLDVEP